MDNNNKNMTECKACGKEIAKGVKKCVNCGKDQRNFFMRHKILTGGLALVLLFIIGSIGGGSNVEQSPQTTSNFKDEGVDNTDESSSDDKESSETEKAKTNEVIGKAELPYNVKAKNGMALTINDYEANSSGVRFNVTLTNHSTMSEDGDIMLSTYEIYDGKDTLNFRDMDSSFYDVSKLRSEQSVTGNVTFNGLSHETDVFTLYGGLWQGMDREEFKIKFTVE